jgi:hypothetical protein
MLKKYFENKKRKNHIIFLARSAFVHSYPDRKIVKWNIPPEQIGRDEFIVTICFDIIRPPGRTWWKINTANEKVRELEYEMVKQIIEIPMWR